MSLLSVRTKKERVESARSTMIGTRRVLRGPLNYEAAKTRLSCNNARTWRIIRSAFVRRCSFFLISFPLSIQQFFSVWITLERYLRRWKSRLVTLAVKKNDYNIKTKTCYIHYFAIVHFSHWFFPKQRSTLCARSLHLCTTDWYSLIRGFGCKKLVAFQLDRWGNSIDTTMTKSVNFPIAVSEVFRSNVKCDRWRKSISFAAHLIRMEQAKVNLKVTV